MIVINIVTFYLIFGILTYLFFILGNKLQKLDEDTSGTGIGFKLIILPGMLVMWPIILIKYNKS